MPDEPDDLDDAVSRAEDAFDGQLGHPDYEEGLDPNTHDADVIQLRKACRLLDACRLLRDQIVTAVRISVERVDEYELATSKTCCACGMEADSNRVERGLYVCEGCELVAHSDLNAAENMRATVTPSPSEDRSNGCLAQPSVRLFDKSTGRVAPQEQVVS